MYVSFRHENLDGMQITSEAKGKMVFHSNGEIQSLQQQRVKASIRRKNSQSYILIKMN